MVTDMTEGSPARVILRFFAPLLLGDLLQQLYGIVDAIVIGRFVGTDAFAAVGASGAVVMFATSILIGLSMGASAVFSQLYGARRYDELKRAVTTALAFLFCASLAAAAASSALLPQIVALCRMPDQTVPYAVDYLRYVFAGFAFVGAYNAFAFLLRALGDSLAPLLFLAASCAVNLVLALALVVGLRMGVAGAALATLVTQALAAAGCGAFAARRLRFLDFGRKDLVLDGAAFRQVAAFGSLTALQQSVSSFGMLLVQGLVNSFGPIPMAAFAACS